MLRRPIALAFTLCVLSSAATAAWDPAQRDHTFGGAAECSTGSRPGDCAIPFDQSGSSFSDVGIAVLRTSDGRYIAVGEVARPDAAVPIDVGLVKLLRDGTRDSDFGDLGRVIHAAGLYDVRAAALAADDGILVAGRYNASGPSNDIAVVRYLANGTLDAGFGTGGSRVVNCGVAYEHVLDLAVDGSGRVLLMTSYSADGGGLPSGICTITLSASGSVLNTTHLADSVGGRLAVGAIDVSGPAPRFAFGAICTAQDCAFDTLVGLQSWGPPDPSQPVMFLDASSAPPGCSSVDARPSGPLAVFEDGTRVQLFRSKNPDVEAPRHAFTVEFKPDGSTLATCLDPWLPGDMFADMIIATGVGHDLYVMGDYYSDDSNSSRHLGIRRLSRDRSDRYQADDSFDGGTLLRLQVQGSGGQMHFNDPAPPNHRALLDPGVPGDVPPQPQLVVAGSRLWAPSPSEDQDFYVARLGDDPLLFADGLESP